MKNTTTETQHILLVDDMKLNRDITVIILEREGYKVTAMDNALDALRALAKLHFDGILLDIRMPGMDGLTAVKVIRACEGGQIPTEQLPGDLAELLLAQLQNQTTPIIVMTASNAGAERVRGLEAGADDFLAKPFTPERLLFSIEDSIQKV